MAMGLGRLGGRRLGVRRSTPPPSLASLATLASGVVDASGVRRSTRLGGRASGLVGGGGDGNSPRFARARLQVHTKGRGDVLTTRNSGSPHKPSVVAARPL